MNVLPRRRAFRSFSSIRKRLPRRSLPEKTPDDGCHVCARLRRTDDQLHHPRNRLAADGPARELLRDKALLEENGLELPLCLAGVPEF